MENAATTSVMHCAHQSAPLSAEEREARRNAKKQEKQEKKGAREATRLQNALSDECADVRRAAAAALYADSFLPSAGMLVPAIHPMHETSLRSDDELSRERGSHVALRGLDLREFSLQRLLEASPLASLAGLVSLDLSHNELFELPGLKSLVHLTELDVSRNWFRALPQTLRQLPKLISLNASKNFLRPNAQFLLILTQPPLPALKALDLTFNKKCFTQSLADLFAKEVPGTVVKLTITFPSPPGAFGLTLTPLPPPSILSSFPILSYPPLPLPSFLIPHSSLALLLHLFSLSVLICHQHYPSRLHHNSGWCMQPRHHSVHFTPYHLR